MGPIVGRAVPTLRLRGGLRLGDRLDARKLRAGFDGHAELPLQAAEREERDLIDIKLARVVQLRVKQLVLGDQAFQIRRPPEADEVSRLVESLLRRADLNDELEDLLTAG